MKKIEIEIYSINERQPELGTFLLFAPDGKQYRFAKYMTDGSYRYFFDLLMQLPLFCSPNSTWYELPNLNEVK